MNISIFTSYRQRVFEPTGDNNPIDFSFVTYMDGETTYYMDNEIVYYMNNI